MEGHVLEFNQCHNFMNELIYFINSYNSTIKQINTHIKDE